jgi:hypothetical protein
VADMEFDLSDLTRLAVQLGDVPVQARPKLRQAANVTSLKVKRSWQASLTGARGLPGLRNAVSYDVRSGGSSIAEIVAEIGIDKGKSQGPLGNVSEYGTPKVAPRAYGAKALAENQEDFQRGVEIALEQAEREAGL